ncbi:hypothetical protein [Lentzea flaviverrucosa]|uniref:hypothetical protein n=1 Tax=Lentzea flaviverrucosa TaxID=200379 RepID=UPI000B7D580F|nr:hypothetical protein [Lentzea flaviverrucosa]
MAAARVAELRRLVGEMAGVLSRPDYGMGEVLTDREYIIRRHREIYSSATRVLRIFSAPPYSRKIEADEPLNLADAARLVTMDYRVITDTSALGLPGALKLVLRDSAAKGCQNRLVAGVPFKMIISDDRSAMIGLPGDPRSLVVTNPLMIGFFGDLFEAVWDMSTPIVNQQEVDDLGAAVGEEGRHLLALLAAGYTDAVIGLMLGLSERTVQRRVQLLMKQMGADTRFQAGVNAAKRGWF